MKLPTLAVVMILMLIGFCSIGSIKADAPVPTNEQLRLLKEALPQIQARLNSPKAIAYQEFYNIEDKDKSESNHRILVEAILAQNLGCLPVPPGTCTYEQIGLYEVQVNKVSGEPIVLEELTVLE